MQARRIARELALLSFSQLPANPDRLSQQQLSDLLLAAIRTLASEARETLEAAAAELQRSNQHLLHSETRSDSVDSARTMVKAAIEQTQTAINRLGNAMELPEFLQLANQSEVRNYALELLSRFLTERKEVDALLNQTLVDWNLDRLAAIDRNILRIAAVEMLFLGIPDRIAINEAVELAKRYSGDDGHRFINGVLRRFTEEFQDKRQQSAQ